MGSTDGSGKGNLLITYIFKSDNALLQVLEESELKYEIAKILSEKGYKYVIADDKFISDTVLNNK